MAYNSGYNPDALPAHAEPEQAAQLLSTQQQRKPSNPQSQSRPYPNSTSNNPPRPHSYSNAPPPQQPPYDEIQQSPYQNQQPTNKNQQPLYQNDPSSHSYSNSTSYSPPNPQAPHQSKPRPPLPPPVQQLQPQAQPQRPLSNNSYTNNPKHSYNASPPPPQNYGFGPPPQRHHGRSPPHSRPPGTPAPTSNAIDASLFPLFKAVDANGAGYLTERELGKALVNGDFTSFDPHTVKMMIRMFDADKSGSINFEEFCGLWGFLASWRALFDRFDEDNSGSISFDEFSKALVAFGYRLSSSFVNLMYTMYDKSGHGQMSFDLFVQSCIVLKRMTDVFKRYDDDRDGYITLSFEEFLTEILRQR